MQHVLVVAGRGGERMNVCSQVSGRKFAEKEVN